MSQPTAIFKPVHAPTPAPTLNTIIGIENWSKDDLLHQGLIFGIVFLSIAISKQVFSMILKKWFPTTRALNNDEDDLNNSIVVREAGLVGITIDERMSIIEKTLQSRVSFSLTFSCVINVKARRLNFPHRFHFLLFQ